MSTEPQQPTTTTTSAAAAAPAQSQGWLWNKLGFEDVPANVTNKTFYDLSVDLPGGKKLDMKEHEGKAVLIVNTASQW